MSGPSGNANEQEGSSSESSSGSSSSDESVEHDGEGAGEHPGGTECTEEHRVVLGERVDERLKHIEQQATGDDGAVEEQEGGAAAEEGGTGVQQQEGGAAVQDFGIGVQQQEGGAAVQEGGVAGQQQEGGAAAQEGGVGGQQQEGVAASGGRGGYTGALGRSNKETPHGQWQRTGGPFDRAPFDGRPFDVGHCMRRPGRRATAEGRRESSKSTLKKCGDAVNGVTEERKLLEGARTKLDEMSGKIIEGVAATITKRARTLSRSSSSMSRSGWLLRS
ncbi:unnamed protein product [Closterium sp. Naga37s-1]|nr:unnamed protein product [Closterium sp. Naga37s-1]